MSLLLRAAMPLSLLLIFASCDSVGTPSTDAALSKGESDALDNAAEMLDAEEAKSSADGRAPK
jgi:hypothetical protein